MHDSINFSTKRRTQRTLVVGEEVITSSSTVDSRMKWQIKAQMRVAEKEYSYAWHSRKRSY